MRENEFYAMWWSVKKSRCHVYFQHFTIQTDHQSLMHLTKRVQHVENERVVRLLGRLIVYDFTLYHIKDITCVPADALYHRSLNSPTSAVAALVCDDSHFLSRLRYSYMLNTHSASTWGKFNTGRHVKHYGVEDAPLSFRAKCGMRELYIPASLRAGYCAKVHDYALTRAWWGKSNFRETL